MFRFLFLVVLLYSAPCAAFVVDDFFFVFDGSGDLEVQETLNRTARWDANPANPRGLADGIQVRALPGFLEEFAVSTLTAEDAEDAIRLAFSMWETPEIRFDIEFDSTEVGEIMLTATDSSASQFVGNPRPAQATFLPFGSPTRMLTNGQLDPGNVMLGATILFATDRIGSSFGILASLVLHEIGHTLGFDHPGEFPFAALDTDTDPSNLMVIDPLDPTAGLMVTPFPDSFSVMNGAPALSLGDRSGLAVLYPSSSVPEPSVAALGLALWVQMLVTRRWREANRRSR